MPDIEITATTGDGRIAVKSPYNAVFVARARKLAGKWDPTTRRWVFPAEVTDAVRNALRDVYGQDDQPTRTVRLRVHYERAVDDGSSGDVTVAGRQVARAFGRDSGAKLGDDVVVLRGGFSSGGSRKNWVITVRDGTVFDLLRIPEAIAHRLEGEHPDLCRIVSPEGAEPIDDAAVDSTNIVPFSGGAA